ncbi:MAG: M50 family metallopeptidase [Myxococcales bacterium]|nr:M50 family metallopeptidase [Myxococcales bacterium]MCB9543975.1 M50 family metallopeptidase [Myxococcales bacterium]MCB9550304.1 M50 family metallopeptidase [Myxococcales bacterium]
MFDLDDRAEKEGPPMSGGDKLILIGFCVVVFGLFTAEVLRDFGPARLSIVWFLAAWVVLTAIHEAGHALVARLVGWKVDRLQLGFGTVLARGAVGGVPVELRAFPIVGLVGVVPDRLAGARWKNALIYAAGPGVELAAAALVAALVGWETIFTLGGGHGRVAAQSFCLAALIGAGLNLIPFSPRPGQVTDGLGILLSPVMPRVHFEAMMVRPELRRGFDLLDAGRPQDALAHFEAASTRHPEVIVLHAAAARALVALGRGDEALMRLRRLIDETDPDDRPDAERAFDELRAFIAAR